MSDAFLLTSKAEGLGLPILEAMAVGLPCVGTNCTGIRESLLENRGYLIDADYVHVDPFGNGHRYFPSRKHGVELLEKIYRGDLPDVKKAREYVENRDWNKAVDQLDGELMK
jgi:glycosyltransferase involved in cell wall biosynthesis